MTALLHRLLPGHRTIGDPVAQRARARRLLAEAQEIRRRSTRLETATTSLVLLHGAGRLTRT